MSSRPLVIVGLLGTRLDQAPTAERWDRWRPTVSLFQHEDLEPERLVLLAERKASALAEGVAADVRSVSPSTRVERVPIHFRDPWDFADVYGALSAFAGAYPFEPEREDYLVHITTGTHVAQICLFLLVETRRIPGRLIQSSPPSRAEARRAGPGRYAIIDLDLSRYDQLAARFAEERRAGVQFLKGGIPTRNAAFNALIERIEGVALCSRDPILLCGPTGVGKTQLARRIHELKRRAHQVDGALVEVNCATLRGDQSMSALFGHEKGSFTGAVARRDGLLRAADGGVLFLDEIGELGRDEQAMLLRAIEEQTFLPVGADAPVTTRFQLMAGTNRELHADVRAGRFREDLLARIDLWTFTLPPLRERLEDLEPNLEYELERLQQRTGRRVTFNREARARFLAFATSQACAWRANFRDFAAAVTRLGTLADRGRITVALVEEESARLQRSWSRLEALEPVEDDGLDELLPGVELDRFDRVQLAEIVRACRRARTLSEAGRELFAVSRRQRTSTNDADRLRKYLARFGLRWEQLSRGPAEGSERGAAPGA
jgi:transcriptional regulatory protein RtcR